MASTALKKVQLGKQSVFGTGVAATAVLMGVSDASLSIVPGIEVPRDAGIKGPGANAVLGQIHGEGSIEINASYEDLPYLLEGVFGEATPGGVGPYTRDYAINNAADQAPRIQTFEFGVPTVAPYRMVGGIVSQLQITGEAGGHWMSTADLIGQKVEDNAMTGALSNRVIEYIRMADTSLYIDAAGGTVGSTVQAATLISFDLTINPNRHLKVFAGSLNPGGHGEGPWEVTLNLQAEFTAAVKAIIDAMDTAIIERQVRIQAVSGDKEVTIDLAGVLQDSQQLFQDRDGNVTVDLAFTGKYNAALANSLEIEVINDVAALA